VQGVFTPASHFSVNTLDLSFMPATLGLRDLKLILSVEMTRLKLLPIIRGNRNFKSQIKPNLPARRNGLRYRYFYRQAQPPVPHRILRKTTALPGGLFE
jgi:hypothetical protein